MDMRCEIKQINKTVKEFFETINAELEQEVFECLRFGYYEDEINHYEFTFEENWEIEGISENTKIIEVEITDSLLEILRKIVKIEPCYHQEHGKSLIEPIDENTVRCSKCKEVFHIGSSLPNNTFDSISQYVKNILITDTFDSIRR